MTPPIDHDAIFKELLSTFFLDFLKLFVPQVLEYAEPSEFRLEPTETVREVFSPIGQGKKKVADVVARLSFRDEEACFLVHLESQSSAYSQEDFRWRMFHYFARLHEKFRLPVYPIALFTFDEPFTEQENKYVVSFPDRQVLDFSFVSIQLNRLNWRDFLKYDNPVALALMAKMRMAPSERAQVKAECLRLLVTLRLDREKMAFIFGFIGTYLPLNDEEEEQFQQALEHMDLGTKESVMEFVTDWQEKGRKQGLYEGRQESKQEDILRILEVRFEDIPPELRKLVSKINDLEVLGTLLTQAVTTQSLEAFKSAVSQHVSKEISEVENSEQSSSESED
ncbi:MAG: flagellar assembly protein H [Symploca sp. SIO1C4]|uniref:Flagellar assembly protein H n=1 Tax=Symploca sp. SIO1C4 TaxID=2607765 RepID=A0A6B3N7U4_9CYAN|nr:flagellar assembly protein H [Symploca sp. SIO1C4]